jgi:hypothetical protein
LGALLMLGRELPEPRRRVYTALLTVGLWLQLSALALTASRLGMLAFLGAAAVFLGLTGAWRLLGRDFRAAPGGGRRAANRRTLA